MDDRVFAKLDEIQTSQKDMALKIAGLEGDLHAAPCANLIQHEQWHRDQEKHSWDRLKFVLTIISVLGAAILGAAATAYFMGAFNG